MVVGLIGFSVLFLAGLEVVFVEVWTWFQPTIVVKRGSVVADGFGWSGF